MKKIAMLALVLITAFATVTQAQNEKRQTSKKTPEQRAEMITQKLARELQLTSDQTSQIKPIVLKREKMRDQGKLTKDDRERIVGDINNVLTKEQQDKWIQMREEAREKHKAEKGHQNHGQNNENTDKPSDDIY